MKGFVVSHIPIRDDEKKKLKEVLERDGCALESLKAMHDGCEAERFQGREIEIDGDTIYFDAPDHGGNEAVLDCDVKGRCG